MRMLLYDGSLDGLLTALSLAFAARGPVDIAEQDAWQPGLFDASEPVSTDPRAAVRMGRRIREQGSGRSFSHVVYAHMADTPDKARAILAYVRVLLRVGRSVDQHLAEPAVATLLELSRKVGVEAHRLKGLVRFRSLANETLWAPIAPVHDVALPVARHFAGRMPRERWLIHDTRRRYGVFHEKGRLEAVDAAALPSADTECHSNEALYADLWRRYFDTIAIRERSNPGLQRQLMPRRYWTYLTEMAPRRPA